MNSCTNCHQVLPFHLLRPCQYCLTVLYCSEKCASDNRSTHAPVCISTKPPSEAVLHAIIGNGKFRMLLSALAQHWSPTSEKHLLCTILYDEGGSYNDETMYPCSITAIDTNDRLPTRHVERLVGIESDNVLIYLRIHSTKIAGLTAEILIGRSNCVRDYAQLFAASLMELPEVVWTAVSTKQQCIMLLNEMVLEI